MSQSTAAATTTAKATKAKKAAPKKAKSNQPPHPKFITMIIEAINHYDDAKGSSRVAILNFIVAKYRLEAKAANNYVKRELKSGVESGELRQTKGIGANGSFKIGNGAAPKARKPRAPRAKKPTAAKATTARKSATPKKTAAKRVAKPKSPAKTTTKRGSPKKRTLSAEK